MMPAALPCSRAVARDFLDGGAVAGIVVVPWDAQGLRQVVGSDEEEVHPFLRGDLGDGVQRSGGLDLDEDDGPLVGLEDPAVERNRSVPVGAHAGETALSDRRVLDRFDGARAPARLTPRAGRERRTRRHRGRAPTSADAWQFGTRTIAGKRRALGRPDHPLDRLRVEVAVLRVEHDEIEPGEAEKVDVPLDRPGQERAEQRGRARTRARNDSVMAGAFEDGIPRRFALGMTRGGSG